MADAVEIAKQKAAKPLTDAQRARLAKQRERTEVISRGVVRGPNAPASKIFGGVKGDAKKGPK